MPTKTPTKKTRDTAAELRELVDEGVAILETAFTENRPLRFDEAQYFRREWLLSEWETDRLLRKYEAIKDRQQIAGTADDRAALAKAADDAAKVADEKGSELRAEIEKLQKRLNGLERDRDLTAKRRDETEQAVAQLRAKLPTPLQRLYDDKRLHIKRELLAEANGLRSHAQFLDTLMGLDPADQSALSTLHSHAETRELVTAVAGTDRMIRYHLDHAGYREWRVDAERERDEAVREATRLQGEYDAAMDELDSMRDYWVQ